MVTRKHIFIALKLSTFQKKLENSQKTKINSQKIFIEYKHMIKKCVDNFALDLLILYLVIKDLQILLIYLL